MLLFFLLCTYLCPLAASMVEECGNSLKGLVEQLDRTDNDHLYDKQ